MDHDMGGRKCGGGNGNPQHYIMGHQHHHRRRRRLTAQLFCSSTWIDLLLTSGPKRCGGVTAFNSLQQEQQQQQQSLCQQPHTHEVHLDIRHTTEGKAIRRKKNQRPKRKPQRSQKGHGQVASSGGRVCNRLFWEGGKRENHWNSFFSPSGQSRYSKYT
ncbi:hypothetical protein BO86DRAFT_64041 [Aspergillus japonicus CBS 114.51]|uniref:Uncharacterized protein n=1 Tax=Aspergillus japonicus CBS 114.51 TaxID=1448312 RepID=A0A8T8X4B6_ASPJA|nr:hypothetical protein BO86DRAFT_64041 [Aspergillus japonicus CBS 114.51]RAH82916.1 hypothetical protein BO86DRAFT_64041 [Aspergillus japonicus CBS 114.51]